MKNLYKEAPDLNPTPVIKKEDDSEVDMTVVGGHTIVGDSPKFQHDSSEQKGTESEGGETTEE